MLFPQKLVQAAMKHSMCSRNRQRYGTRTKGDLNGPRADARALEAFRQAELDDADKDEKKVDR